MLKNFNAGKSQLLSFDRSNDNGSIDVNMEGCVLEERPSVKMLGLTFSSKLDWGSYINLSYACVWNTVVMSELVPQVDTWSYKNEYAGLLVLH